LRGLHRHDRGDRSPSLYELAVGLIESLEFDFDHSFGFYSNLTNAYGDNDEKYTLFADMGESESGEAGVQKTATADVFKPGKKMLLLFDYGDGWHFLVTCISAEDSTKIQKEGWKTLSTRGELPIQYPD